MTSAQSHIRELVRLCAQLMLSYESIQTILTDYVAHSHGLASPAHDEAFQQWIAATQADAAEAEVWLTFWREAYETMGNVHAKHV